MATSHIKSISVVAESAFGSLDSGTNLPDATIFSSALSLEAERADLATPGEPAMNERIEARSSFYELPPEPETVLDGDGNVVQRRTGSISFSLSLRTGGDFNSAGNGYDDSAIAMLLASGMTDGDSPASASDYGVDVSADVGANSCVVTGTGKIRAGDLIAVDIAGKREYSAVTEVTASTNDTIKYSPAFSRNLDTGDTIRTMRIFASKPGSLGSSVAFEVTGDGWRSRCYGCRWETLEFSLTGRKLMLNFTFQCALIQDAHGSVSPTDPVRLRGRVAHFFPSEVILSAAVPQPVLATPATVPFALARAIALDVDEFSATITNTLSPVGYSESILGMSDMEVTDRVIEVNLTCSVVDNTTTPDDFNDAVQRSLIVGFGPVGAGNGACLYVPSAVLKVDPNLRDLGGDIVRQAYVYGAGRWAGDSVSTNQANTHIRLGLAH